MRLAARVYSGCGLSVGLSEPPSRESRGSLVCNRQADRIDGLDVKSLRLLQKIPPPHFVILESGTRERDVQPLVAGLLRIPGRLQGPQHAPAHFGGSRQW